LSPAYKRCRELEHEEFKSGRMAVPAPGKDEGYAETLQAIIRSGNYFADHFEETPLLILVFAIDDHGGANIFPAIWSALLAARVEGVGGIMTTLLRYVADSVNDLLGVPVEQGWRMSAMLAFGYPLGRWGVAAKPLGAAIRCGRAGALVARPKPIGVAISARDTSCPPCRRLIAGGQLRR
jgi:Nitroreductase family